MGIKKLEQAEQDHSTLEWRLTNGEIRQIDGVSFESHITQKWQQGGVKCTCGRLWTLGEACLVFNVLSPLLRTHQLLALLLRLQ